MPYISQASREKLDEAVEQLIVALSLANNCGLSSAGDVNYVITRLLITMVNPPNIKYEQINSVVGVLTCAKDEFYRRFAVPYENQKIEQNGDVSIYAMADKNDINNN